MDVKQPSAYILIVLIALALSLADSVQLMAGSRAPLAKTGSVLPMGPLKVNPVNPRYFTDGTGKAIYLTGSHTWNNFQDIGDEDAPPFDYTAYLDFLKDHNHNFIRLWVWEHAAWFQATKEKILFCPMPYERTGPGEALDGKLKFDLNRFNQKFFDRLRARVIAARERGIYVSVMLFQGFSIEIKGVDTDSRYARYLKRMLRRVRLGAMLTEENNPWRGHPFNARNNINGINGDPQGKGDGREIHTMNLPRIMKLQEEYVKKVIDTLNDLDNVLWEISNEGHSDSTLWQYHMINFIHAYEGKKGRRHPVWMTAQWPGGENSALFKSHAESISPNSQDGYKDNPPVADGRKIIISDTDHLWGMGGDYRWIWKSFLTGLNPIFMDPYNGNVLHNPPSYYCVPASPEWELMRKNMGFTLTFAKRIHLVGMVPRPDLASSGYCLAENGKEYLIYTQQNGKVTVDLSHVSGKFIVEWFNPMAGVSQQGLAVKGGASRSFAPPFSGDAVLYLSINKQKRQAQAN